MRLWQGLRGKRNVHQLFAVALTVCCLFLFPGCQTSKHAGPVASVEHVGVLAGFPEGKEASPGRKLFFEPSALIQSGDAVLIANDKLLADLSPVLSVPLKEFSKDYIGSADVTHLHADVFQHSSKLESLAASARWGFAATDFDRMLADSPEEDTYNNLIAWPTGQPEAARIVCPSERGGVVSSRELRASFIRALKSPRYPNGPPYFKIEALASPNARSLIFGVREIGTNYEHQEYCFILVEATVNEAATNGVTIGRSFRKLLDFHPVMPGKPKMKLGLSSLEFDPELQVFVAVTSYEENDKIGACLWVFTATDLVEHKPPRLVRNAAGEPLFLPHKAEGLVALGDRRFLAICDDDQILKPVGVGPDARIRKPNEAVFYIIRLGL